MRSGARWLTLVALFACGPENPDRERADAAVVFGPLEEEFLAAHNVVRAAVGVGLPPMTWSAEIAEFAQAWADELKARTGNCDVRTLATPHRPSSGPFAQRYGENISWNAGSVRAPANVVDGWASEAAHYSYASNSCDAGETCGHYTQVVWRDSLRLGCGLVRCDGAGVPFGTSQIWVCNYEPPGNVTSQRPY